MKIAIAGAGAMGGRFGYMLQKAGQDVFYIDGWAENVDKLNKDGLTIEENGEVKKVPARAYHLKNIGSEQADFIILFVKSMQLLETLQDLQSIIHENTKVLCLLNGLGHVRTMERFLSRQNIYLGVTLWTAKLLGPAQIQLSGDGSIELQNMAPEMTAGAEEIVAVLNQAGLKAKYSSDVIYSVWKKACVNGAMNAVCAILDCRLMDFRSVPDGDIFIRNIIQEFAWAAKTESQVELDQEAILELILFSLDPSRQGQHYPSMHQDLIGHHRKTEIDYLNGYVWRLGKEKGVSTPYCEMITILTHGKEAILGVK